MDIGMELMQLCKETMDILMILKAKGIITKEEYNSHITEKENYIRYYNDKKINICI